MPHRFLFSTSRVLLCLVCIVFTGGLSAQVLFLEESTITNEGLYFYYADGSKAFHYNPNISPRGDCMTVVDGYVYFGWFKGGMSNRKLMISRKKIGSEEWVNVELPHQNTLIQPGNRWGDSHRTISVGVSKIDGTVHIFFDHHNDPLNYIVSKKNIAFAPDSEFTASNFETSREYLAVGENVRITYPKITQNEAGEIIVSYRKGSAVGGGEIVHVYDGFSWTRSKQISDGSPGTLAQNPDRIGWNYAYGVPYYNNGDVYYAFSVRWAEKKADGILNEGVYLAKTGPKFADKWEDLNGVKHDLPIIDFSPFLIEVPPSNAGKGSSGGPGLVVSEAGDIHISYDGRGSGDTYKYTYTRLAGETNFTRHDGVQKTGMSWNNRFYTAGASGNRITITSGEPGSVDYREELVHTTDRSFGVNSSYISNGKLVMILSENKASDKKDIYSYVFQLPTGDQSTTFEPIAHWPLDEGTGTDTVDLASESSATLRNGPVWGSDVTRDSYVTFDGVDDRIETEFKYALSNTDSFTWAWWANKQSSTGPWDTSIMIGNRFGTLNEQAYEYIKFSPSGAEFADTNELSEIEDYSYTGIAEGGWHHYAMVKIGTTFQWFVDGVPEGKPVTIDYSESNLIPFMIGGDGNNQPLEYFNGSIDDVVLYDRALSAIDLAFVRDGNYKFPPKTALDKWREGYFGTVNNSGVAADHFDANNDGESNLLEFATGQDPMDPAIATKISVNGSFINFHYARGKSAEAHGIEYTVEWSEALEDSPWNTTRVIDLPDPDASSDESVEKRIARILVPGGSSIEKLFFRLRVAEP